MNGNKPALLHPVSSFMILSMSSSGINSPTVNLRPCETASLSPTSSLRVPDLAHPYLHDCAVDGGLPPSPVSDSHPNLNRAPLLRQGIVDVPAKSLCRLGKKAV